MTDQSSAGTRQLLIVPPFLSEVLGHIAAHVVGHIEQVVERLAWHDYQVRVTERSDLMFDVRQPRREPLTAAAVDVHRVRVYRRTRAYLMPDEGFACSLLGVDTLVSHAQPILVGAASGAKSA